MRRNLILSGALTAFLTLVLPLQTYLGNSGDYGYSLVRLLLEQSVAGMAVVGLVMAALWASDQWLRGWLTPLLVGLVVCVWLESSFLSMGLPELNGELPAELGSLPRRVWDSVVLGLVVVGVIATFRWTRAWLHVVGLGVLAMGLASLLDVRPSELDPTAEPGAGNGGFAISSEIVRTVEYSPTRNVLMFVLDTMPANMACDIMESAPTLRAKFPGFTAFRNNIGMHDCTKRGVSALMTGTYYKPGTNPGEYLMSALGTNSFLQVFRDRGDSIYCLCDNLSYGFTTAKTCPPKPRKARWRPAVAEPAKEIPYMCLLDVVAFRAMPFAMKQKFLFQKLHSRKALASEDANFVQEHVMYPQLAQKPISKDLRQMFGKFHTWGSHMPLCFDADGNRVAAGDKKDPELQRQAVSNALVKLGRLMDAYRARGLYDKAFIVVTTDHGSKLASHPEGAHGQASANLWVKPDGATSPFSVSDLPTSHARIAPLMRRAAEGPISIEECQKILRSECRLFRYVDRDDIMKVYDWVYRPDGSFARPTNGYPSR